MQFSSFANTKRARKVKMKENNTKSVLDKIIGDMNSTVVDKTEGWHGDAWKGPAQ